MIRTTVFFDEETRMRLRSLARRTGLTQAQVLREAVARYEVENSRPALPPGIGEFRSGRADTASRTREILANAARSGSWRRR
ncbi:MAG: hypothetical protein ACKVQQ_00475 [Burkholderiales bacterium]